MNRRQCLLAGLPPLSLGGCVSIGTGGDLPSHAHHLLTDPGAAATPARTAALVPALLIQPLPSDALADTVSIAYSRQPNQFAFYQFASWTERPVRQIPRLLQRRLEARRVATAVGLLGEPLRADWLLTVAIDTLHHDVTTSPGRGRIALTVELFDRRQRRRVDRQQFASDVTAASADAAAATNAMSQALAQSFDVLLPWLEASLQRATT